MREEKAALRRALRERRGALAADERRRRDAAIQAHLLAMPEFARARTVLLYVAVRGEAETRDVIARALGDGKRVVLPRVVRWQGAVPPGPAPVYGSGGRGLALHLYSGPADLVPGPMGLLEPRPDAPWVTPGEVDLAVVPGVAFDRTGARLGQGGGFYDRFLPCLPPGVPRVGYAYAFQVVDAVPAGPGDQRVDAVVTDEGIIRCRPDVGPPST